MVRIGIVGVGFMGMVHYLNYQRLRGARVTALCDSLTRRLAGDWRDIQGNFGPRGQQMDLTRVATYEKVDGLIADADVDLVDICLPPAAHASVSVQALRAGKDVFCEKPMALTVADTRRMEAAAKASGRTLMVGHVLPTFPEYDFAVRTVRSGKYGKLLGGHFKRVISDPAWLPRYYEPDVIGGPMLDLHIHDAHFIRYLFGMPQSVTSQGRMRGEVVEYFTSQFSFDDTDLTVTATSGVVRQPARSFLHGYEIHLERATLAFEFAMLDGNPELLMPCTLLPEKGRARRPKLGSGDPMDSFQTELKQVLHGVRTGEPAQFLQADLARDAIRICHQQTASVKTGRRQRIG